MVFCDWRNKSMSGECCSAGAGNRTVAVCVEDACSTIRAKPTLRSEV